MYVTKVKGTIVAKKKDKKKGDQKARKKDGKPAKLPKQIAGVKVPKELRDAGGKVAGLLRNPLVMDLAAAALVAAAAGLREGKGQSRPAGDGPAARPPAADLGAMLATKAVEGVRKLAAGANGGKPGGDGGSSTRN